MGCRGAGGGWEEGGEELRGADGEEDKEGKEGPLCGLQTLAQAAALEAKRGRWIERKKKRTEQ